MDDSLELYDLIFKFMDRNQSCSYSQIREWATRKGHTYDGKSLEDFIYWAVEDLVDRGMAKRESYLYMNMNTSRYEHNILFCTKKLIVEGKMGAFVDLDCIEKQDLVKGE